MNNYLKNLIKDHIDRYNHYKNYLFYKENNFVVLLYHRIQNEHIKDPTYNYILTEEFYNQIKFINKNYDIISIDDIYKVPKSSKPKILITFDDAYKDNYKNAFPILKQFNLSSLIFLPTYFVNEKKVIWDRHISLLLIYANDTNKKLEIRGLNNDLIFVKEKNQYISKNNFWFIINYFKKTNIKLINKTISNLTLELDFPNEFLKNEYCLSFEDIQTMNKNNISFGSHSHYHLSLKDWSLDELMNELTLSKSIVEKISSNKCKYFAFPFGSLNDFNYSQIQYLSPLIFEKIFLNIKGLSNINYKFANRIQH